MSAYFIIKKFKLDNSFKMAMQKRSKINNKPASRSVKYSDAEEEPFKRFILMQLPQCEEAVNYDIRDGSVKAIYGATEYILRELTDRKSSSLKTKFNKILKKEAKPLKEAEVSTKDTGCNLGPKVRGLHSRKALVPLLERDFIQNPMLLMIKGYQKAQLKGYFNTKPDTSHAKQVNNGLDSMLGKRNMESQETLDTETGYTSAEMSGFFCKKRHVGHTDYSAYLSCSEFIKEEKASFRKNINEASCDHLLFGREGTSEDPQIIDDTYDSAVRNDSDVLRFSDSLFAMDFDPTSETNHLNSLDDYSIDRGF
jgi:hypothetical protein